MHPPLDRPHPDCQDVIAALKECHESTWKKFTGGCNDIKFALDRCFVKEKERALAEMNQGWRDRKKREQETIMVAFEKDETFEEFLAKDKVYQRELAKRKQRENPQSS